MASCDVQTLLDSSACFDCLSPGLKESVKLQLLCEILNAGGGGGGGGTVLDVGVTTANGVSAVTANASTHPRHTFTLSAITPSSVNGNTITVGTGTLTLGAATLNAGPGGTLGTAAFTAAGDYEVPLTFSGGLTRSVNTITPGALTPISAAFSGTAGAGFISLLTQSSAPAAPASGFALFANATGLFSWRNAADGFTRSFEVTATANRVFTLPNADFTFAGLSIAQTFSAANTFSLSALGTSTNFAVKSLNTTAAAVGAQQVSPSIRLSGNGWGTTAGTSQAVEFQSYVLPIQNTVPTGNYIIQVAINGGAYSDVLTLSSSGVLTTSGSINSGNNVSVTSSSQLNWSGGRGILTSPNSGQVQMGATDAASPLAQTLSVQSVVTGTTDTAGADWTRTGSRGTGTAKSGNIVEKTGNTTTTGNTPHTLSTRAIIAAKFVDLTPATATTLFTVTVGTNNYIGITIDCTIFAAHGGELQVLHSVVNVGAVNKAGTLTMGLAQVDGAATNTSGTLTPVTYTAVDNGSGVLAIKVNATTSLSGTPTTLRAKWQARFNSNDAATVTAS